MSIIIKAAKEHWKILINLLLFSLLSFCISITCENTICGSFFIGLASTIFGLIVAFFAFNVVLESNKTKKWEIVGGEVLNMLREEIKALFYDINLFTKGAAIAFWSGESDSWNNINKKYRDKLNERVGQDKISITEPAKIGLTKGSWHDLFLIRADSIGNYELKYSKYYNPIVVISLIRIQKYLKVIDLELKLYKKNPEINPIPFENLEKIFKQIFIEIKTIDDKVDLFAS